MPGLIAIKRCYQYSEGPQVFLGNEMEDKKERIAVRQGEFAT